MDSEFDNENEHDDMDDEGQPAADSPKALRRAADEGRKAKAELASAKRELAMLKAGVDLESPIGKLFAKAYDGDTAADAIKAEWAAIAPKAGTDTPVAPEPVITDDEARSTTERQALANNSPADIASEADPRETAFKAGLATRAQGGSTEDALGAHFNELVRAAIDGDKRVTVEAWK
jgi:hypothetical protein